MVYLVPFLLAALSLLRHVGTLAHPNCSIDGGIGEASRFWHQSDVMDLFDIVAQTLLYGCLLRDHMLDAQYHMFLYGDGSSSSVTTTKIISNGRGTLQLRKGEPLLNDVITRGSREGLDS